MVPRETVCGTLVEFLDRMAIRRGRDLYPQNSHHRGMIGFVDAESGEWFLIPGKMVVEADPADSGLSGSGERLGRPVPEILDLLRTTTGIKILMQKTEAKKGG